VTARGFEPLTLRAEI